jgi:hypothetical protein
LPLGEPWISEYPQKQKAPLKDGNIPAQFDQSELDESGYYWTGVNYYNPQLGVSYFIPLPALEFSHFLLFTLHSAFDILHRFTVAPTAMCESE